MCVEEFVRLQTVMEKSLHYGGGVYEFSLYIFVHLTTLA